MWRHIKREPASIAAFVIFMTLVFHNGGARLWTAPIAAAGWVVAIIIDELWQGKLDAPNTGREDSDE